MKSKIRELDVDSIGGEGPLTKEEQQKISEYLKRQKILGIKKQLKRKKALSKKA